MALTLFVPSPTEIPHAPLMSPLVLADRLITLAQQADRSGYPSAASRLIAVMYSVLDGGADVWN